MASTAAISTLPLVLAFHKGEIGAVRASAESGFPLETFKSPCQIPRKRSATKTPRASAIHTIFLTDGLTSARSIDPMYVLSNPASAARYICDQPRFNRAFLMLFPRVLNTRLSCFILEALRKTPHHGDRIYSVTTRLIREINRGLPHTKLMSTQTHCNRQLPYRSTWWITSCLTHYQFLLWTIKRYAGWVLGFCLSHWGSSATWHKMDLTPWSASKQAGTGLSSWTTTCRA